MAWTSVTSNLRCSPDGRVRERSSCERRPAIERGAARRVSMRSPDLSRQEPGGKYLQPDLRLRTRTLSRHLACARAATSLMHSGLDRTFRSSVPAETGHGLRGDVPDDGYRIDTPSGEGLADSTLHAKADSRVTAARFTEDVKNRFLIRCVLRQREGENELSFSPFCLPLLASQERASNHLQLA